MGHGRCRKGWAQWETTSENWALNLNTEELGATSSLQSQVQTVPNNKILSKMTSQKVEP